MNDDSKDSPSDAAENTLNKTQNSDDAHKASLEKTEEIASDLSLEIMRILKRHKALKSVTLEEWSSLNQVLFGVVEKYRTDSVLNRLEQTIQQRKNADPLKSYTAGLMQEEATIKRKIGEEALEVVMCKPDDSAGLCSEVADLWFHCMVLMVYNGLSLREVCAELASRMGTSGLDEKESRTT